MTYEKLTKRAATDRGLLKYFTGKPCRRGHVSLRYTKTGGCRTCVLKPSEGFLVTVRLLHPDDTQTLRDFAQALNLARKL